MSYRRLSSYFRAEVGPAPFLTSTSATATAALLGLMVTGLSSCVPGFPADSDASDQDADDADVLIVEAGFPSMGKDSGAKTHRDAKADAKEGESDGAAEVETEAQAEAQATPDAKGPTDAEGLAEAEGSGDAQRDAEMPGDANREAARPDAADTGVDTGSPPIGCAIDDECTASDPCHVPGTCDKTTGICSNPLQPGATCQTGQTCIAWYPDCDVDGYGDKAGTPVYSCSSPTVSPACPGGSPTGTTYVADHTDCCDTDKNAHPGQTAYFTTEDACGATTQTSTPYDYNCDGVDEQQSNGPTDCTIMACVRSGTTCSPSPALPADCNGSGTNDSTAACGTSWSFSNFGCVPAGPGCTSGGGGGLGGTQACH
jgi:hypothetical protein